MNVIETHSRQCADPSLRIGFASKQMSERDERADEVKAAIAGLEAQRSVLRAAVVEPALAALRQQLADLDASISSEERKVVTILFVDISGFTALSEKLDAEEVRKHINGCFEHLVPCVQKYEGTVSQFIGDEIMALFGAPAAHENDPERALRAALEMMDAIETFNRAHRTDLGIHIGINTGPVVTGKIGTLDRRDHSVMGDAVNLAARLEDASVRGQIFVGPNTYRHTSALFDFETLPALKLQGKKKPVPIHRLIGLKTAPKRVRGIEGLWAPLVGRESELEQIQSMVRAVGAGKGGVCAIVGEAGVGKSRLIAEALHSADIEWAKGRSLAHTEGMSYWMARDLLRSLVGLKADTPADEMRAILQRSIEGTLPESADNVFPYLARLLEIPLPEAIEERVNFLTGEALQGRILQAFKDYVRARAAREPLILFWEDLHWCDPSSLLVLENLASLTRNTPVLLLLAWRPDVDLVQRLSQFLPTDGDEANHVIELSPLTREESSSLVQSLLRIEGLPDRMRDLILDRAEGNPFFLEELIRSLLDAGILTLEQDRVVATRAIESVDVPETLQGVLMSRIDRLALEKKQALQNAAVIGRVFQQRVLANLYENKSNQRKQLDDSLAELQHRGFIRPPAEQQLEDRQYIFRHAITHEVAYNSLLIARRKQLHKLIGEALEAIYSDRLEELSATLAFHFQKAEAREKAIHYLRQAAERAQAIFANAEAIAFYQSALAQIKPLLASEVEPDDVTIETAARLYEGLGDVLKLTGQHDETRAACELGALALVPKKPPPHLTLPRELGENATEPESDWWTEKVQIQIERLHFFYWQGMAKEMIDLAEQQRALIEERGSPIQRGLFFLTLALSRLSRDRYLASEEALDFAKMAVSTSEGASDLSQLSHIRFVLGFVHHWRGNLADAAAHLNAALKISEKVGYTVLQIRSLTYLALTYRRMHQIGETRRYALLALKLASEAKFVEYEAMARANLAWIAWREARS